MTKFPITIQDTSPLIRYSANWQSGGTQDDRYVDQYSTRTFMYCKKPGDIMSFSFYGTEATVYGALRVNHGTYSAQIDAGSKGSFNGKASPPLFGQVLYNASSELGNHEITITNGDNYFDLDYITFITSIGKNDEQLIVNTFQNNHPSFIYTPVSSWKSSGNGGMFSGSSVHATNDSSAIAKFTFRVSTRFIFYVGDVSIQTEGRPLAGDAIALYGPVGPGSSNKYSVRIDDNDPTVYSANKQAYKAQELLYYAGNLGLGEHTLEIQHDSTTTTLGELAIDYATVYTTASLGGRQAIFIGTAAPNVITVQEYYVRTPTGVIVGLALTSTLALVATIACMYFFWRQKRMIYLERQPHPIVPESSLLPTHQASLSPFVTPPTHCHASNSLPYQIPLGTSAPPIRRLHGHPQGKRHVVALVPGPLREGEAAPPQYTAGL